jgi:hypothetical protein
MRLLCLGTVISILSRLYILNHPLIVKTAVVAEETEQGAEICKRSAQMTCRGGECPMRVLTNGGKKNDALCMRYQAGLHAV